MGAFGQRGVTGRWRGGRELLLGFGQDGEDGAAGEFGDGIRAVESAPARWWSGSFGVCVRLSWGCGRGFWYGFFGYGGSGAAWCGGLLCPELAMTPREGRSGSDTRFGGGSVGKFTANRGVWELGEKGTGGWKCDIELCGASLRG